MPPKSTLEYKKIRQNELQFRSLTGLSPAEFEALSADFSLELEAYMSKYTFEGKERVRVYKPRKRSSLPTVEDKLFFILVFMKTNPLQEHHAAGFGISQPKANMFIHLFIPLLRKTLKRLGELPARKASEVEELLKNYDDVLLDGTGRPIQKPSDNETADEYYSGKKNS
ncbi:hypothetical protein EZS27_013750 [termite gut metagenome]|uniref:Transposase Helix-turn-helix domain-containing protein n=1 Tax=termite gut metagenome TaxID=433724 RepID=A0A5J4RWP8_9ZZZZ